MIAMLLEGVSKTFPGSNSSKTVAVDDVTLEVRKGEIFALVGPDGAGKTTTIRMMTGVLRPDRGTVSVLGLELQKNREQVKRHIGYLSQKFSLYGDLSVDENIDFFAEIHSVKNFSARKERLLEFTRLGPFRSRLAGRLSGGMKQKLALACTLVHGPEVLVLDEPTTGVDPVSRRDFWGILQSLLAESMTIVMSTPYLDEAERCTKVALMSSGRLMDVDTPESLRKHVTGTVYEIVCDPVRSAVHALQKANDVDEVQAFGDRVMAIVPESGPNPPSLKRILTLEGVTVENIRQVPPSLENVFISLLTHPRGHEVRT
jgi:ABC-2 type transport system ATP-binding protein